MSEVELDVWLRQEGEDWSEAEANTYRQEDGLHRVDWCLTAVGLIKSRWFATHDEARAWLEDEGFDDYTS